MALTIHAFGYRKGVSISPAFEVAMTKVTLVPLAPDDWEQFIKDNQEAFNYGALEEFGLRDDHLEEDGEIISCKTIHCFSSWL